MTEKLDKIIQLIKTQDLSKEEKEDLIKYLESNNFYATESLSAGPDKCPYCGRKFS